MTIEAMVLKARKELLASQVSRIASDTNENLLRVNLTKFFTELEHEIQSALMEYWNDHGMLMGQLNLILAPIHEKHQEYYELIMKHKLQEFHRAEQQGKRLVKRARNVAMKSARPVQMKHDRSNLFGTLKYSEDKLATNTFTASQNTLNRVDSNINQILTDGYREGVGINEVSRQITERFDQLRTWEAKRIARTEIHTAQNQGIMNSYDQLGVEYTQWISAEDDRTRESHAEIDREIIPIGSTYSNGLAFPGDTSGPIEEWINCRCSNAPFVIPEGMMAPSFSPFREEDLIEIPKAEEPPKAEPVEEAQPTETDPTQTRIAELEKEIAEVQAIADKWKSRGKDDLAQTFQNDVDRLQAELDKLKKPTPKVIIEEPAPSIDINGILDDVLGEYGLNKPKTKPKPKPEPKETKPKTEPKPKEQPTITLKEHLQKELPSDFTNETLDYIVDKVKKRANAKREYGQIFDYKTGKGTSPEFNGGKSSVAIKEEDWIKPPKQMTRAEQIDALSNPSKYKRSFVDGSNTLASIHNHPSDGSRAFSGADIYITLTNKWEDYGLAISDKEIWCSEFKGTMNFIDAKEIEKKVDRLFTKSRKQAMKKVIAEHDDLPIKEKREIEAEYLKDIFGDNLLDFFNKKNKQWGIKLRRVRYVE